MKKNYKIMQVGLCAGIISAVTAQYAMADGYRNPPPTAEGIGKSGVNAVWVDDASAISYNPANLAFQTNQSIVASFTFARTENTYTVPTVGTFESSGDWNVLPNLYYSVPLGESGFTIGLGITTPHGQGMAWDSSDLSALVTTGAVPYEASVALIDIGPSVAYRISDSLAIGAGLDLYVSQMEIKALVPLPAPGSPFDAKGEGTGYAVGGNLAATWIPADGHRAILTYKSQFEVDYDGDFEVGGTGQGDYATTLKYPNIIGLGYGIQLTDRVQLEALVEWLQWSINEEQVLQAGALGDLVLPTNWDDTFTFGLGGSWQALDSLVVRAGYAFIPSPIPDETITYLLPDADRHAISFGLGYTLGAHTVDLAYTFSIYEERSGPSGLYEIDSNLVGLTYSASF